MTESMTSGSNVSIALLHHPVYDKNRQVVTTAVTNLDLHDIARAARTFGLFRYFVVTPVAEQRALAERIGRHWQEGWGATYNPKRRAALELMRVVAGLDDALEELRARYGRPARIVVTGPSQQHFLWGDGGTDPGAVAPLPTGVRYRLGADRGVFCRGRLRPGADHGAG